MKRTSKKLGVKIEKPKDFNEEFKKDQPIEEDSPSTVVDNPKLQKLCVALDNMCLDAFNLMEQYIKLKLDIEKYMTHGELHLVKSRYIMGQRNVSSLQLPTANNENLSATITINEIPQDKKVFHAPRLELIDTNDNEDNGNKNQDPLKWFGVLVPQDLRAAQTNYKCALNVIVEAANIQIRLNEMFKKIRQMKTLKNALRDNKVE